MQTKIGVVLLSGGLDSAVALWWAKKKGGYGEVHTLTFFYGSREERITRKVCEILAALSKVERQIFLELPWLGEFSIRSGATLVEGGDTPPKVSISMLEDKKIMKNASRSVWIPARNLCFVSIAASYAESIGGEAEIITGFNKEEAETFPDNSPIFIERMNALLEVSTIKAKVALRSPLIHLDKRGICALAKSLGVPVEYSNSCYDPAGITKNGEPIHCGLCESCARRKRAFLEAVGSDPTIYAHK